MAEFLPLCDVLFNIISLTLYFCNVVFDVVLSWALHTRGSKMYFVIALCIIFFALVISQIISLRWYLKEKHKTDRQIVTTTTNSSDTNQNLPLDKEHELADNEKRERITRYAVVACHLSCVGIFWRYAKLFVPVDLRTVKHEVRDLCVLRVIHAFCEAAPMLLLQLHVYISFQKEVSINKLEALGEHVITPLIQESSIAQHQQRAFRDLNVVSAVLSLFSICWALASFSKHVRLQSVHRLVLTWLGVIFQVSSIVVKRRTGSNHFLFFFVAVSLAVGNNHVACCFADYLLVGVWLLGVASNCFSLELNVGLAGCVKEEYFLR